MKVFKLVPVVEAVPDTISAFTYSNYTLYLGTQGGVIFKYKIANSERAEEIADSGECVSQKLISKKRIDSITVIERNELLCCLCEGTFYVMSSELNSVANIFAKGVSAYCFLNSEPNAPIRLCVATKKKLSLYILASKEFMLSKELVVSDVALALCWDKRWICVGFRKEYAMIKETDGTYVEIFALDAAARVTPRMCLLADNELMLITQDSLGIFFNLNTQQPSKKATIQWDRNLLHLGAYPPYIIGCTSNGVIQVYSIRDQRLYQTLDLSQYNCISDMDKSIFLASSSSVSCLHPIPYNSQMRKLLLEVKISEALELLNSNFEPDDSRRAEELGRFHLYAGWTLFNNLQFPGAFQHFSYAKLNASLLLAFWKSYLPVWWQPYATKDTIGESASSEFDDILPQPLDMRSFSGHIRP